MGGMSMFHWLIVIVIVLIVFGPSRLPGLGKSLGQAIRGFKKGLDENLEDSEDETGVRRGQTERIQGAERVTPTEVKQSTKQNVEE